MGNMQKKVYTVKFYSSIYSSTYSKENFLKNIFNFW